MKNSIQLKGTSFVILLTTFCCLFISTFSKAQQWTTLTSGEYYSSQQSIYFTDTNTGYVCGSNGKIFKTSDAGNVWDTLTSGTSQYLSDIYFSDTDTGYTCGNNGTILKTIDAGVNWTNLTSGISNPLNAVFFSNANTGYVVGNSGKILKTSNGGNLWTTLTSGTTVSLSDIYFTNANTGYAVGSSGTILKTIDAGVNWTNLSSGTSNQLNAVFFTNTSTGYVAGNSGTILKTGNGGNTWFTLTSGTTVSLYDIYFTDASTGYATGGNGTIKKTTNSGSTWITITSPTPGTIYSIFFTDFSTAHIGIDNLFYKTTNGGTFWSPSLLGNPQSIRDIYFTNANTGYSLVEKWGQVPSIIRKTSDGGNTWTDLNSGIYTTLLSIHFTNSDTGYAVGEINKIIKTTNAGTTWTSLTSGASANWQSVYFIDANTGYTCASNGTILKTINAGANWTALTSGTTSNLYSIYFTDANTGYVAGATGIIKKTVNGGNTWTTLTSGTTNDLRSVYFTDANTGYAVGSSGTIIKTINGGNTWSSISSGTTSTLNSIHFSDNNIGFICGSQGKLLKSTDAGSTWIPVNSGTINTLFSIHFPTTYTGYAAGALNTILKGDTCAGFSTSLSATHVSCYGGSNGSATLNITGGNPTYSYLWSNGQTTSTATGLSAGTYSVTTKMAGQQCPITKSIIVTQPSALLSADITSTTITKCSGLCSGSASIVNVSGGTPPYTYNWSNNQTTATANLCEGNHSAIITDQNGCWTSKHTIIDVSTVANSNIYLTNLAAVDLINVSPSFSAYYTYNLPTSITPPPSNPRNFVDPGKKARFKVECTNNKSNGQSIVSGICKVRSNNPYITITDSSSALNNIGWSNYAWSADEFEINIDPNTPPGTNAYIDFVVQESGQDYSTTCIAIPISPLVYSPTTTLTIDDDNNPDSQGNDNDICESNEIIEFYPWMDNISTLNAEYVRGRFENLDNLGYINIWNGVQGVGTTVYDATWWNYSFAQPQIINASDINTTPEYDFVFNYNNANTINDFKLYMVMAGGFKLFSGNALSLVQWTLPYTFAATGSTSSGSELENTDGLTVFPNPTNDFITIKNDNLKETYVVFNSIGQQILTGKLVGEITTVDISHLQAGLYLLQVGEREKQSFKLMKE